ncbi:two-component system, chemotaxis family, response regulator CheY [Selenomonas sp. GACV-9]|uniref:response regulator n=1 Tax=Selenomonas sp. GACV-9 TaxID=3158782 RepID=UPI0008E64A76|nr:two-component system, chemotaxis family, response regulator CheY [Selenomonas ruminantium]
MKILIADDDRRNRMALEEFMKAYGSCDLAADGMETIDHVLESVEKRDPYDLLCLDIMMPKVDGLKVLKVVRGLEEQYRIPEARRAKILMVTAIADVNVVDQAFQLGCDAYASKPLHTEKMLKVMADLGLDKG